MEHDDSWVLDEDRLNQDSASLGNLTEFGNFDGDRISLRDDDFFAEGGKVVDVSDDCERQEVVDRILDRADEKLDSSWPESQISHVTLDSTLSSVVDQSCDPVTGKVRVNAEAYWTYMCSKFSEPIGGELLDVSRQQDDLDRPHFGTNITSPCNFNSHQSIQSLNTTMSAASFDGDETLTSPQSQHRPGDGPTSLIYTANMNDNGRSMNSFSLDYQPNDLSCKTYNFPPRNCNQPDNKSNHDHQNQASNRNNLVEWNKYSTGYDLADLQTSGINSEPRPSNSLDQLVVDHQKWSGSQTEPYLLSILEQSEFDPLNPERTDLIREHVQSWFPGASHTVQAHDIHNWMAAQDFPYLDNDAQDFCDPETVNFLTKDARHRISDDYGVQNFPAYDEEDDEEDDGELEGGSIFDNSLVVRRTTARRDKGSRFRLKGPFEKSFCVALSDVMEASRESDISSTSHAGRISSGATSNRCSPISGAGTGSPLQRSTRANSPRNISHETDGQQTNSSHPLSISALDTINGFADNIAIEVQEGNRMHGRRLLTAIDDNPSNSSCADRSWGSWTDSERLWNPVTVTDIRPESGNHRSLQASAKPATINKDAMDNGQRNGCENVSESFKMSTFACSSSHPRVLNNVQNNALSVSNAVISCTLNSEIATGVVRSYKNDRNIHIQASNTTRNISEHSEKALRDSNRDLGRNESHSRLDNAVSLVNSHHVGEKVLGKISDKENTPPRSCRVQKPTGIKQSLGGAERYSVSLNVSPSRWKVSSCHKIFENHTQGYPQIPSLISDATKQRSQSVENYDCVASDRQKHEWNTRTSNNNILAAAAAVRNDAKAAIRFSNFRSSSQSVAGQNQYGTGLLGLMDGTGDCRMIGPTRKDSLPHLIDNAGDHSSTTDIQKDAVGVGDKVSETKSCNRISDANMNHSDSSIGRSTNYRQRNTTHQDGVVRKNSLNSYGQEEQGRSASELQSFRKTESLGEEKCLMTDQIHSLVCERDRQGLADSDLNWKSPRCSKATASRPREFSGNDDSVFSNVTLHEQSYNFDDSDLFPPPSERMRIMLKEDSLMSNDTGMHHATNVEMNSGGNRIVVSQNRTQDVGERGDSASAASKVRISDQQDIRGKMSNNKQQSTLLLDIGNNKSLRGTSELQDDQDKNLYNKPLSFLANDVLNDKSWRGSWPLVSQSVDNSSNELHRTQSAVDVRDSDIIDSMVSSAAATAGTSSLRSVHDISQTSLSAVPLDYRPSSTPIRPRSECRSPCIASESQYTGNHSMGSLSFWSVGSYASLPECRPHGIERLRTAVVNTSVQTSLLSDETPIFRDCNSERGLMRKMRSQSILSGSGESGWMRSRTGESDQSTHSSQPLTSTDSKVSSGTITESDGGKKRRGMLKINSNFPVTILVPHEVRFPSVCCVGLSTVTTFTVENPSHRWVTVDTKFSNLEIINRSVTGSIREKEDCSNSRVPFVMKPKVLVEPKGSADIKVVFIPYKAGVYIGEVSLSISLVSRSSSSSSSFLSSLADGTSSKPPILVTLQAIAELPNIEMRPVDESNADVKWLDFGAVAWGSRASRRIMLVNHGQADVPVRLVINSFDCPKNCFSFDREVVRAEDRVLPKSASHTEPPPYSTSLHSCTLKGVGANSSQHSTHVTVYFIACAKSARSNVYSAVVRYDAGISLELDTLNDTKIIERLSLTARVGTMKIHTPKDMKCIKLTSISSSSSSHEGASTTIMAVRNAGSLPVTVRAAISNWTTLFAVTPDQFTIAPGEYQDLAISYQAQPGLDKQLESKLTLTILPTGPVYDFSLIGMTLSQSSVRLAPTLSTNQSDSLIVRGTDSNSSHGLQTNFDCTTGEKSSQYAANGSNSKRTVDVNASSKVKRPANLNGSTNPKRVDNDAIEMRCLNNTLPSLDQPQKNERGRSPFAPSSDSGMSDDRRVSDARSMSDARSVSDAQMVSDSQSESRSDGRDGKGSDRGSERGLLQYQSSNPSLFSLTSRDREPIIYKTSCSTQVSPSPSLSFTTTARSARRSKTGGDKLQPYETSGASSTAPSTAGQKPDAQLATPSLVSINWNIQPDSILFIVNNKDARIPSKRVDIVNCCKRILPYEVVLPTFNIAVIPKYGYVAPWDKVTLFVDVTTPLPQLPWSGEFCIRCDKDTKVVPIKIEYQRSTANDLEPNHVYIEDQARRADKAHRFVQQSTMMENPPREYRIQNSSIRNFHNNERADNLMVGRSVHERVELQSLLPLCILTLFSSRASSQQKIYFSKTRSNTCKETIIELKNVSDYTIRWSVKPFTNSYVKKPGKDDCERLTVSVYGFSPNEGLLKTAEVKMIGVNFAPLVVGLHSQHFEIFCETLRENRWTKSTVTSCKIELFGEANEACSEPRSHCVTSFRPNVQNSGCNQELVSTSTDDEQQVTRDDNVQKNSGNAFNTSEPKMPQDLLTPPLTALSQRQDIVEKLFHGLILVKPHILMFKACAVRSFNTMKYELKNNDSAIHIVDVFKAASGGPFTVRHHQLVLRVKHYLRVPVDFHPTSPGLYEDSLVFTVDKKSEERFTLKLSGKCI